LIAYLLFYGVQYGVYFDFHPIMYGTALLAAFACAVEMKKVKLSVVLFILVLLTQENMGLAFIGLSFFYFVRKDKRKLAMAIFVIGAIYTLIAMKVIAWFSPVGFQYQPEITLNPLLIMKRFFDDPAKIEVWKFTLLSFGGLPLLFPPALFASVFDLFQYLATGPVFFQMWSVYKHHRIMLALFLALGTIEIFSVLKKKVWLIRILSFYLLAFTLVIQLYLHLPLNKLSKSEYWRQEAWMSDAKTLFTRIPQDASLATQQNYVPHLSHRQEIYLIYPRMKDVPKEPCGQKLCWWLEWGGEPQYIVVDTRPNQWLTQILESNENWLDAIVNMEVNGNITLVDREGDIRFYEVVTKSPDL
jgi:uncharacterized membrane protein